MCGRQIVLVFGGFSQIHKWHGGEPAKGKGKRRHKARRFKAVVKECMSTTERSNLHGDSELETFRSAHGIFLFTECNVVMDRNVNAASNLTTRAK